ncbi:putative Transmembrane protein [Fusarium oxysporum f. sp. albedinis]|nr:putative Transmembrane protein [Fusarium oxysporum f. sp. albedinis]
MNGLASFSGPDGTVSTCDKQKLYFPNFQFQEASMIVVSPLKHRSSWYFSFSWPSIPDLFYSFLLSYLFGYQMKSAWSGCSSYSRASN